MKWRVSHTSSWKENVLGRGTTSVKVLRREGLGMFRNQQGPTRLQGSEHVGVMVCGEAEISGDRSNRALGHDEGIGFHSKGCGKPVV